MADNSDIFKTTNANGLKYGVALVRRKADGIEFTMNVKSAQGLDPANFEIVDSNYVPVGVIRTVEKKKYAEVVKVSEPLQEAAPKVKQTRKRKPKQV